MDASFHPKTGPEARKRPRRLRWLWLAIPAIVLVTGIVGWYVVKRAVQIDRYRPQVCDAIRRYTGLPTTVAELDLALFPVPAVQARSVTIGENDFQARARRIVIHGELKPLLNEEFQVTDVQIQGLEVTLPSDLAEAVRRLGQLTPASRGEVRDPRKPARYQVTIGEIRVSDAKLLLGDDPSIAATCSVTVFDPLAETIRVETVGDAPILGENAKVSGEILIHPEREGGSPTQVEASVAIESLESSRFVRNPGVVPLLVDSLVTLDPSPLNNLAFIAEGEATPVSEDVKGLDSLNAAFRGKARWQEGALDIREFRWDSPGLGFTAAVHWAGNSDWALSLPQTRVTPGGLAAFQALYSPEGFTFAPRSDAILTGTDIEAGPSGSGFILLKKGQLALRGVDIQVQDAPQAFPNVRGTCDIENGVFHIKNIESDGLAVNGTVEPNLDDQTYRVDLGGSLVLTRERLAAFMSTEALADVRGTVAVKRFRATFRPGEGLPEDLAIEGSLESGALRIETDAWQDRFDPLKVTFRAKPGQIETIVSASTDRVGAVTANGTYLPAEHRWQGTVEGNLSRLDIPLPEGGSREVAPLLLAVFGQSAFDVSFALPASDEASLTIEAARRGTPPLSGQAAMAQHAGAWTLGDVTASGQVPLEALASLAPANCTIAGPVDVSFSRSYGEGTLSVMTDLTGSNLTAGAYVKKPAGDEMVATVNGEASQSRWSANTLAIEYNGETIRGQFGMEGLVFGNLDLDMARLAELFPAGASPSGRVRGSVQTVPLAADLRLDGVALALNDKTALDSVTGRIAYGVRGLECENLRVQGANSDCLITAGQINGQWQGSVTGNQLDLNAVELLMKEFTAFTDETRAETPPAQTPAAAEPFRGRSTVQLGALRYHNAVMQDVRAEIVAEEGLVRTENLSLRPGEGQVTGVAVYALAKGDRPASYSMNARLENVPAAFLDGLAFAEPRELRGSVSGDVLLDVSLAEGIEPYTGMNGTFDVTATSGSLGKLGLATKLLTVLRATEITRLRIPALRDQGLVYDTCTLRAGLVSGVLNIEQCLLKSTAYELKCSGIVDFPRWNSDLVIDFNPLESVTGVATRVPVLGEAVQVLQSVGGLRFFASGPPDNPKVIPAPGGAIGTVTDSAAGAARTGTDAIKDTVRGVASEALRRLLDQQKKE